MLYPDLSWAKSVLVRLGNFFSSWLMGGAGALRTLLSRVLSMAALTASEWIVMSPVLCLVLSLPPGS